MQLDARRAAQPADVMAGGERRSTEVAGESQKIGELDPLVAAHTRDGRAAGRVGRRELLDHRLAEPRLHVERVVRDPEPLGDGTGILEVAAGAAGLAVAAARPLVVELQGDAHDLEAGFGEQCRRDRAVHPTRHGDDHARARRQVEVERSGLSHRTRGWSGAREP